MQGKQYLIKMKRALLDIKQGECLIQYLRDVVNNIFQHNYNTQNKDHPKKDNPNMFLVFHRLAMFYLIIDTK